MGTLNVPAAGVVYVDTAPIIYSVEKHPDYWALLQPLWVASQAGQIVPATSELTLLETLVLPLKQGNSALVMDYEDILTNPQMWLLPITSNILYQAAHLRARHNFKTPDALHAATALASGCVQLITNDAIFRRVPGLNVVVLHELVTP